MSELKLLVNAVECSQLITPSKSAELIEKLGSLTSNYNKDKLCCHIYLSERLKSDNEEIYNVMESVYTDVNLNRQITFSFEDIGRDEGVGASTIKRSIEIAFRKLKPYSDFLQNVAATKWVNLL